ncbi:hypothetical protein CVN76_24140 [Bacillus sp. mrc49]|nr:hypothetical protein CVN76_24140 [Bacillus sp. mrc49]
MRVYLRLRRLNAEEAQGPPAEREHLQCNGTDQVQFTQNWKQIQDYKIKKRCCLQNADSIFFKLPFY